MRSGKKFLEYTYIIKYSKLKEKEGKLPKEASSLQAGTLSRARNNTERIPTGEDNIYFYQHSQSITSLFLQ